MNNKILKINKEINILFCKKVILNLLNKSKKKTYL